MRAMEQRGTGGWGGGQTWKDTHHYLNLCGMTLEVGLGGRQMHFDHGCTKKDNTTMKWEEPTGKNTNFVR